MYVFLILTVTDLPCRTTQYLINIMTTEHLFNTMNEYVLLFIKYFEVTL